MPVEKTETVGSRARSYDRSLGIVETRLYMCDLDDADALLMEYSHNVLDTEVGLYFNRYRSSIQRGQCYATCSLVFTGNPDITLTGGSNASHADGDTEYDLSTSSMEKPLESHPDYKANWNYELWAIDGTTSNPAWWTTATSIVIDDADDRKIYQWVKPGSVISGWYRQLEVYHENPPSTVDFRGVEAWRYPAPVMTQTKYYRDRDDAMAQVIAVDCLAAPGYTGPYSSGAIHWLVTNSRVYQAGRYWCCVTTFEYADIGWNTALYAYAD